MDRHALISSGEMTVPNHVMQTASAVEPLLQTVILSVLMESLELTAKKHVMLNVRLALYRAHNVITTVKMV